MVRADEPSARSSARPRGRARRSLCSTAPHWARSKSSAPTPPRSPTSIATTASRRSNRQHPLRLCVAGIGRRARRRCDLRLAKIAFSSPVRRGIRTLCACGSNFGGRIASMRPMSPFTTRPRNGRRLPSLARVPRPHRGLWARFALDDRACRIWLRDRRIRWRAAPDRARELHRRPLLRSSGSAGRAARLRAHLSRSCQRSAAGFSGSRR